MIEVEGGGGGLEVGGGRGIRGDITLSNNECNFRPRMMHKLFRIHFTRNLFTIEHGIVYISIEVSANKSDSFLQV